MHQSAYPNIHNEHIPVGHIFNGLHGHPAYHVVVGAVRLSDLPRKLKITVTPYGVVDVTW